jgi:tRNA nucleotidyltransferase (CCA-adding enzyme)
VTTLNLTVPGAVRLLVNRVAQAGGKALLVGGAVIDVAEGREPKDWDLEVFGLDFAQLETLFADHDPKTVGQSFGVLKLAVDGLDVDINVPRTDNKVGVGHTGFEVELDPTMTVAEAALRRDFTINAMALDLATNELHDPFGGLDDLDAGVLRVTDPTLFVEDPLRALRAMQLLARKAKTVDPATMMLIRGMVDSFPELAKERVHEEFRKLLLKADRPSVGFEFLRESGWIKTFTELEALIGCPQRPEWHPEGDVWVHSLLAADAMAEVRHLVPEHQREAFAFAVPLHDIGKPSTTITPEMMEARDPRVKVAAENAGRPVEDMLLTAHGHDQAGMDPAESLLRRMTNSVKLIKLVRGIVGMHMQPWNLRSGNAKKGGYARLHRKMQAAGGDLELIGRMCQCDSCATGADWKTRSLASGSPNWEHESSNRVFDFVEEFAKDDSATEPLVLGRDLIGAGMKPGPEFGKLLKLALDIQDGDATLTKEEILTQVLPA